MLSLWECGHGDIAHLADLSELQQLGLTVSGDDVVRVVGSLSKLQVLNLVCSEEVRDLSPLTGLKELRQLWIQGPGVTDNVLLRLQTALPDCEINIR